jgi:hypothetical protein
MLRRHPNKSLVKATRRKVVLRRYANKSRVKVYTQTKVMLKRYANKSRVKVFTQIIGPVPMPRKSC